MKIVHIAPNAPYNEGWGYQENLLTKYQVRAGNDVTLIIRNEKHEDGRSIKTPLEDYVSSDGFRVIRLEPIKDKVFSFAEKLKVFDILKKESPDLVFYHGLVSTTIFDVVKYKKKINPGCIIVQDNHLDYNIGVRVKTFKQKVLRAFYRIIFKLTQKNISKVYGVTPWRKKYVEDYFKVPSKMTDVLIMGADDEKIDFQNRDTIRKNIREKYSVSEDEFLIVTGGKVDKNKKIHLLMKAVNNCENVKLLVFGNVLSDVEKEFNDSLSDKIIYIGWLNADEVYDYFFASDLILFPGQHSVLWEQACASKVPCVFEKWEGMDHVDNGGNSDFISVVSEESLTETIEKLKFTPKYYEMKKAASSEKTDIYLYSKIAERSLECFGQEHY